MWENNDVLRFDFILCFFLFFLIMEVIKWLKMLYIRDNVNGGNVYEKVMCSNKSELYYEG